ncbi:meiotically up-regulated gene 113-domain-containing protein [Aspergillus multicolor]|uniref:GIY-YIG nuclease family protein n=1 Tax=Aspergillus multicolor TaxID=41759 RepID=UPI003CCD8F37
MAVPEAPQTPFRGQRCDRSLQDSLSPPSTPSASPVDEAPSVFSPNESILTDLTDYGWDSSSRKDRDTSERLMSLSSSQIMVEGTASLAIGDTSPSIIVGDVTEECDNGVSRANTASITLDNEYIGNEQPLATVAKGPPILSSQIVAAEITGRRIRVTTSNIIVSEPVDKGGNIDLQYVAGPSTTKDDYNFNDRAALAENEEQSAFPKFQQVLEDTARTTIRETTPVFIVREPVEGGEIVHEPAHTTSHSASNEDGTTEEPAISTDKDESSSLPLFIGSQFSTAGVSNRRCSFNAVPKINFLHGGQTFRGKTRAKSTGTAWSATTVSIDAFHASIPQSAVPLTGEDNEENASSATVSGPEPPRIGKEDPRLIKKLKKLIPPHVKDRLVEDGLRCVADIQRGGRCSKKAKNVDVGFALRQLNVAASEVSSLYETAQTLFSLLLCGIHQKEAARSLTTLRPNDLSDDSSDRVVTLEHWLAAAREASNPSEAPTPDATPSVAAVIPPLETRFKTALPNFIQYHPPDKPRPPVSEELERIIVSPLTAKDVNTAGHIYIYQCQGKFGYCKIGYSTDHAARLQSWEKQCGRELTSYFPRSDDDLLPVPHVTRVERLIHAELAEYRRKELGCPGTRCGRTHKEWFEVNELLALLVVRKWLAWMQKLPYRRIPGGSTWVLDVYRVGDIREVCTLSTT